MTRRRKSGAVAGADSVQARVKRHLVQRLYCRFHMSLILGSAALAAMLVSWTMLQMNVHSMWIRYLVAVAGAYAVFLLGVGLWLRYVARVQRESAALFKSSALDGVDPVDALDVVEVLGDAASGVARGGTRVGGGNFGGAGAGGSWTEPGLQQGFMAKSGTPSTPTVSTGKGFGFDFDFDLDGDGLVVLVLALAVIAAVVFASGYIVWFAPDILAEAVVGAALAGSLAKTARREDGSGWVMGVVKKTWWPFAIVMVLCVVFARYAQSTYPEARTAKEVISRALAPSDAKSPTPAPGYP